MTIKMKKATVKITSVLAIAVLGLSQTVWAGSLPQVSYERERTAEEWQQLRDNKLEWEELQSLVHEYNPTIAQQWLSYRENDSKGVYDIDYEEALEEIENTYSEALSNSSSAITDASAELSYQSSLAGIDQTIAARDRDIARYTVMKAEKNVTEQLRAQLISIYTGELTRQLDEKTAAYQQTLLESMQRKLAVGQATELQVLTQEKAVKDAGVALTAATSAADKARRLLLVNLGWKYDDTPEIAPVPMVTEDMITSIDTASDAAAALSNSFEVLIAERKTDLAEGDTSRNTSQLALDQAKESVYSSMQASYQSLLQAANSQKQAELALQNASASLDKTTRSFSVGSASSRDLEKAQYDADAAALNEKLAEYAVAKAYYSYEAMKDGLAGSQSQ